ncbi:hypothetical protein [Paenibacillus daejeonensis]|uniref:hypothetical protein n=1 Tax=Paenibacillus daejeonensis TaxID=135193 RepID=UPI000366D759|nr:hypothetical protein [Paenibacillus daejeonensis]
MRCCILLDKSQRQIEEDYYFIDLPELLTIKDQRQAKELLDNIDVISFPHSDKKGREGTIKRLQERLPKPPKEQPKSAKEQYEALKARRMGR